MRMVQATNVGIDNDDVGGVDDVDVSGGDGDGEDVGDGDVPAP